MDKDEYKKLLLSNLKEAKEKADLDHLKFQKVLYNKTFPSIKDTINLNVSKELADKYSCQILYMERIENNNKRYRRPKERSPNTSIVTRSKNITHDTVQNSNSFKELLDHSIDDKDDCEFTLNDLQINVKSKLMERKQAVSKSTRIANPTKRRQIKELSTLKTTASNHDEKLTIKKDDQSTTSSSKASSRTLNYNWITDLKIRNENKLDPYYSKNLIIIKGFPPKFFKLEWSSIVTGSFALYNDGKASITIIPRANCDYMYFAQGLHKSPHFSLGPKATSVLIQLFSAKGIAIVNFRNITSLSHQVCLSHQVSNTVWFDRLQHKEDPIKVMISNKMCELANSGLLNYFLMVSSYYVITSKYNIFF